jgi:hypothetical protein
VTTRFAVSLSAIEFSSFQPQPATLSVDLGSSSLTWNVNLVYAQSPAAWLTVTPTSGAGPAALQVSANPTGLHSGKLDEELFVAEPRQWEDGVARPLLPDRRPPRPPYMLVCRVQDRLHQAVCREDCGLHGHFNP